MSLMQNISNNNWDKSQIFKNGTTFRVNSDYAGDFASYLRSYWEIIVVVGAVLILAAIAIVVLWRKRMLKKISMNEKLEAQKRYEQRTSKIKLRESQAKLRRTMNRLPKHAKEAMEAKVSLGSLGAEEFESGGVVNTGFGID